MTSPGPAKRREEPKKSDGTREPDEKTAPRSITVLLGPLRQGDPQAFNALAGRLFAEFKAKVENSHRDGPQCVADDAVTEALFRLFTLLESGKLPDIRDRDGLRAMLWKIAEDKFSDLARARRARKWGGKDVPFSVLGEPVDVDDEDVDAAHDLAPATIDRVGAIMDLIHDDDACRRKSLDLAFGLRALELTNDEVDRRIESALSALAVLHPECRDVFQLKLEKLPSRKIVERLGMSETRVQRRVREIREQMIGEFELEAV